MADAKIRILHLSDIHYLVGSDPDNTRTILLNGLKKYFKKTYVMKVECVVLTGDFLNQGKFNSTSSSIIDFIKEVCMISLSDDRKDEWQKHVFFCPGNHDANRNASRDDGRGGSYESISRADALKNAISSSPDRMESSARKDYPLLANDSFWLFNHAVCPGISGSEGTYGEYCLFHEDVKSNNFGGDTFRFFFVGINTALYAGQIREKKAVKTDLAEKRRVLFEMERDGFPDYHSAKKTYDEYLRYYNELVNAEADDKGKLCFINEVSENRLRDEIASQSKEGSHKVLFFGHHPLDWLTTEARKSLAVFARTYSKRPIYLCGHEHRPRVKTQKVDFISSSTNVLELEVGGGFPDRSGWNELSFAVYTLHASSESKAESVTGVIGCWRNLIDRGSIQNMQEDQDEYEWIFIKFENGFARAPAASPLPSSYEEVHEIPEVDRTDNINNYINKNPEPPIPKKDKQRERKIYKNDILSKYDNSLKRGHKNDKNERRND